jgi:hypothetical protein
MARTVNIKLTKSSVLPKLLPPGIDVVTPAVSQATRPRTALRRRDEREKNEVTAKIR